MLVSDTPPYPRFYRSPISKYHVYRVTGPQALPEWQYYSWPDHEWCASGAYHSESRLLHALEQPCCPESAWQTTRLAELCAGVESTC